MDGWFEEGHGRPLELAMPLSLTGVDAVGIETMTAPSMFSDLAERSDIDLTIVQPDPDLALSDDAFWTDFTQAPMSNGPPPSGEDDVTELDPVVVIGNGGGGSSGGGGTGSGGPGGDGLPSDHDELDEDPGQLDRTYDACEDRRADTLAQDINDEISRQSDSDRREYGAIIWRDDAGNLHRTALVPGTNSNVPFPANSNELGIDSYNRIVGIVHSHPSEVNLGTDAAPNWVPASEGYMHGGDWAVMDSWVSQNNLSINNFTVYISYQCQTREYDYADNRDPALRAALDSNGSQESGDYNPGATCP